MSRLVSERQVGWVTDPGDPADIATVLEQAAGSRDDEGLQNRVRVAATQLNWRNERSRLTDLYAKLEP
jgi:hypothetical protein